MNRIKTFLEKWGIHSFLLPVFFIIHSYLQYYGLVSGDVAIKIFLKILLIFFLFFILLLLTTKHINKSLQLTTLFGTIILFYGVIKDFFQHTLHAYFIAKYSVLLPIVLLLTILLSYFIIKKKNFRRSNLFQNLLLIIFILFDVFALFYNSSVFLQQNLLVKNPFLNVDSLSKPGTKPNIYYIVLDSYPGTIFLKNFMEYDNSSFNDTLKKKGFYVLENPISNYNRTAFSISSTLNFEYLKGIQSFVPINSKDYNQARLSIKEAIVPKILKRNGYIFYNLSVFDIGDVPPVYRENFLTMPEENVLLYNTLIERLKNDLLWNFITGKYPVPFIQKMFTINKKQRAAYLIEKKDFNNTVIDSLNKISLKQTDAPRFIYAHLYLPHPPFFYNENGTENNPQAIFTEKSLTNKSLFLSYLRYTNKVALDLIEKIKKSSDNTIIILQSDHGFRDFEGGPSKPELFFKNYSAFYFPDGNYSTLYDTMSNVNTFPVIFNKYFNTRFSLQPDTSVFLAY